MSKRIYGMFGFENGSIIINHVSEKPQESIDKIRKAFNSYLAMQPKGSQPRDMEHRIKMFHDYVGDRFCSITIQKETIRNGQN